MEVKQQKVVEIPEWLMAMIQAKFRSGQQNPKDNRKYLCIDCLGPSMTESETKAKHKGHKVLAAYKNSWQYTFRRDDINRLRGIRGIDASGVAPFIINNKLVLFLKSPKPLDKYQNKYGVHGLCFTCGRGLTHPGVYCSILCKYLCCPPNHQHQHKRSSNVTRFSMSSFLEQNQVFGTISSSVSHRKNKRGSKKRQMTKKENKKKMAEEERCPPSLKRKHYEIKADERRPLKLTFKLGARDGNGGMEKTENLNPRKRRRKGIPYRSPFY